MKKNKIVYIIIILTIGIFTIQSSIEPQKESAIYPEFLGEGFYHAVDNALTSSSDYYLVLFDVNRGYVAYRYSCPNGTYFSCVASLCTTPFSEDYCGCAFSGR